MILWDSRTIAPLLSMCHRAPGLPKSPGMQGYLQLQSSHNTQLPAVAAAITVSAWATVLTQPGGNPTPAEMVPGRPVTSKH